MLCVPRGLDCHLALPGTLALLERLPTTVPCRWLPFERHAMQPPRSPESQANRSSNHFWQRDLYRERELKHYAAALDLPLDRLYENPDTTVFASALLWLQGQRPGDGVVGCFIAKYFTAYWSGELSPDDVDAGARLLNQCGASGAQWLTEPIAGELVDQQRAALRQAGLFNSPAYVFQGEVYYGRAHLPLLEALLCGHQR